MMALGQVESSTCALRGAIRLLIVVSFAVLLSACGDNSVDGATASDSTTDSDSNGGESSDDGRSEARERIALPAGGPVDAVFPPGTKAYELLASGSCSQLKDEVATWDASVAEVEGSDTIELYRSAAHACLGEWDDAIAAFDRLGSPPGFQNNACSRDVVLTWLREVIEARRTDPAFDPEFSTSTEVTSCADGSGTDEPTDDPGSTEDEPTEDEPTEDEPTEDEPTEDEPTEDEPTEDEGDTASTTDE